MLEVFVVTANAFGEPGGDDEWEYQRVTVPVDVVAGAFVLGEECGRAAGWWRVMVDGGCEKLAGADFRF